MDVVVTLVDLFSDGDPAGTDFGILPRWGDGVGNGLDGDVQGELGLRCNLRDRVQAAELLHPLPKGMLRTSLGVSLRPGERPRILEL